MNTSYSFPKRRSGGLPPVKTVTEIAELLGVTKMQLIGALRQPDAPKAALRNCTVNGGNHVWYVPKEVVTWYRARQNMTQPKI
jgi:hypothetical protein